MSIVMKQILHAKHWIVLVLHSSALEPYGALKCSFYGVSYRTKFKYYYLCIEFFSDMGSQMCLLLSFLTESNV